MKLSFRFSENGSSIERLNPMVKLAWVGALASAAIILNHPLWLAALLLSTLLVAVAGRIWIKWLRMMSMTFYLCLAIVIINVLINYNGEHILWQAGFKVPVIGYPAVTAEALIFSLAMSLRLFVIISVFAIMTLAVHPDDILQVMYKVRLPRKSVLVVSLATRFFPVLIEDAQRISAVQQSRGLVMDRGSLPRRIKNRTAVLIPLFSNSLDRTAALAEAMEARAFGSGRKRGFYKPLIMRYWDWCGTAFNLAMLGLVVTAALKGWSDYQYYPSFSPPGMAAGEWGSMTVLTVLSSMIVPLSWMVRQND